MRRKFLVVLPLCLLILGCSTRKTLLTLENRRLGLTFDRNTGELVEIHNKLAGETYRIVGDEFSIEAEEFVFRRVDAKLESLVATPDTVRARYRGTDGVVEATYTLGPENHFSEKRLAVTAGSDYKLKRLFLSRPEFSGSGLNIVAYRYQKNTTYFGRTAGGGFFTGVELPFDASARHGSRVELGYLPSLKVKSGEGLESEPVYFGVYRRNSNERKPADLPLQSESDAMVAMTSTILGPPRHGLAPIACGWHSEMLQVEYKTDRQVEGDKRSLDFLNECGIDWVSDSHPWGGENEKMGTITGDQKYEAGPRVREFLEYARRVGVKVVMWPTMNTTGFGYDKNVKPRPFRPDKPEWLMVKGGQDLRATMTNGQEIRAKVEGNCIANRPFLEWLTALHLQALAPGYFAGWAMDGDFFGGPGFIIPVNCPAPDHDHLPGDSNYACEKALERLIAKVREHDPDVYVWHCRPVMDLGVWSNRNSDANFTIDEFAVVAALDGLKNQPVNVALGDKIRKWSRVRVHHHFFPHYLDQPLVFVEPLSLKMRTSRAWPSEKIDYIMLSALSSSPNQTYYLPTKTGIPEKDKAEIRKWLDWGRQQIRYLQVRKDLADWPGAGRVDGSAHIIKDQGLVFLFNPNGEALDAEFQLTEEAIGLGYGSEFRVVQFHPASDRSAVLKHGDTVKWQIPGQSAVVLIVGPGEAVS